MYFLQISFPVASLSAFDIRSKLGLGLGVFPPLQFFVKDLEKDWLYAS